MRQSTDHRKFRRSGAAVCAALAIACCRAPDVGAADVADVKAIVSRSIGVTRVADSDSEATFTLTDSRGQQRVRKVHTVTRLQKDGQSNMRLLRFRAPADVKGTGILLIENSGKDDDIWVYLPALRKVRRLVASNKKDSFAGTDLSYGDVIGHKLDEWTYRLDGEEVLDEQACRIVEAVPVRPSIAETSGYSKRRLWVRRDNSFVIKQEFWDVEGKHLKTAAYADVRLVDPARKNWYAMKITAKNHQSGHQSLISFENYRANAGVREDLFKPRALERD